MYTNIREKLYLQNGGKIPKYQLGGNPFAKPLGNFALRLKLKEELRKAGIEEEDMEAFLNDPTAMKLIMDSNLLNEGILKTDDAPVTVNADSTKAEDAEAAGGLVNNIGTNSGLSVNTNLIMNAATTLAGNFAGLSGALGVQGMGSAILGLVNGTMGKGAGAAGIIGGAMNMVSGAANKLLDLDHNFSGTSLKIDEAVHGLSGLVAGIVPWGTLAAGIMESVNFASKAGGNTVTGYDVDLNSSGYSLAMTHMDNSSSRGLFGFDFGNTGDKLAKRNEKLKMALTAADIDKDNSLELEARMNSVENTIMNNQIALAGGLDSSMLAG